jgi:hypothetical protein
MPDSAVRPETELSGTEVEITPAMIKAGVLEFASFDSRVDFDRDAVLRIYLAMCSVERKNIQF